MKSKFIVLIVAAGIVLSQTAPGPPGRRNPDKDALAMEYLTSAHSRLQLDARHTFRQITSFIDDRGHYHGRFRQVFDGTDVYGGNVIVHIDPKNRVYDTTDKLYRSIAMANRVQVTEETAIETARALLDPRGSAKVHLGRKQLVVWPELRTVDRGPSPDRNDIWYRQYVREPIAFHYAWWIEIAAEEPVDDERFYFIDASTGRVFHQGSTAAEGNGKSYYDGNVTGIPTKAGNGTWYSIDPARSENIVRNAHRASTHLLRDPVQTYFDPDDYWGDGKPMTGDTPTNGDTAQTQMVDVSLGVMRVTDMFRNVFGRKGMDNDNGQVDVRTNWGRAYDNAKFMNSQLVWMRNIYVGSTRCSGTFSMGHEMGHGAWFYNFGYNGVTATVEKAINEGHADIAGSLAEFYTYVSNKQGNRIYDAESNWNWYERMIKPKYRYHFADIFQGEEHDVGSLYGHMFIFLARGASPDPSSDLSTTYLPNGMSGIGLHDAGQLWYRAFTAYQPENADFYDIRDAFLKAAQEPERPAHFQRAVYNAFVGIGIGTLHFDNQAPKVDQVIVHDPDTADGSIAVFANAIDNQGIGRVEFFVDGKLVFADYSLPFGGRADLHSLTPGSKAVKIVAYDLSGNASQPEIRHFTWNGFNQLVQNGGFEAGDAGWNFTGGQWIADPLRTGSGRLARALTGAAAVWQQIVIPANASAVQLAYRVRTDSHVESGMQDQRLFVELQDAGGNHVRTLDLVQESMETLTIPPDRSYVQRKVAIAERGTYRLVLRVATDKPNTRFSIDNVSVTAVQPVSLQLDAQSIDQEERLLVQTPSVSGIPPALIKTMEYWVDGNKVTYSTKGLPFATMIDTSKMNAGSHTLVAKALYQNGSVAVQAGQIFHVKKLLTLIKNGDFENGFAWWAFHADAYIMSNPVDQIVAYDGSRYGRIGGKAVEENAYLRQTFTIPKSATSAELYFRARVTTSEKVDYLKDKLMVHLMDSNGKHEYLIDIGQNWKPNATQWNGYNSYKIKIPASAFGKQWYLVFEGVNDHEYPSTFFVDAVTLTYTTLGVSN